MSTTTDSTMTDTARAFFQACESGGGWEACSAFCVPDATFSAKVEPLADVHTLEEYAEWMKGLFRDHAGRALRAAVLRDRQRAPERLRVCRLLGDAQPRGRPGAPDGQEHEQRLRVRHDFSD